MVADAVGAAAVDRAAAAVDAVRVVPAVDVDPAVRAVDVDPAVPAADAVRAVPAAAAAVGVDVDPLLAEVGADALAQARKAPQAAPWAPARHLARTAARPVRRVRPEGARGRLADQSPDRGRPCCDDAQDQAWRQGLDKRLPGQARDQEAGRDP